MALEGSLKDFGLADILQLIYFQRKTGILDLDSRMDRVKLLFVEGNIVGAESKRRFEDNRLGKILVKKGLIKDEDLRSVLEEQRRSGAKLGILLTEKNLVDKEKIREILHNQITETVIQLFGWKQGTYEFSAQGIPQDKEFPFSLDTQHLLMDGLRIVDELSVIKDRITLDSVLIRKKEEATDLAAEEKDIFACVDGENDVSTIIDLTGMDSFEVSRIVLAMIEKGIIDTKEAVQVARPQVAAVIRRPSPAFGYLPYIAVASAAILSLFAVFAGKDASFSAYRASRDINELRAGIEAYRIKNSAYPQSIASKNDPWGRPYIYTASESSYLLKSVGPDGTDGTGDDIF
jgi:transcription initiation factor IIE alpha subunit